MQQPPETMIQIYIGSKTFQKDAKRLARDGWTVASTTINKRRSSCLRVILLGLFCLVFPPKPEIIVTYQRSLPMPPQQPILPQYPQR